MSAPRWRPMQAGDLAAVEAIGDTIHRDLPERPEVLAEKRALFAQGAFVLERDGAPLGYALAHPWRIGTAPALDQMLGALLADADCLYLHDVAILPSARGHGSARDLIERLAHIARENGLGHLALTSVYGTQDFWASCGFVATPAPGMEKNLASYGGPAIYMTRAL